MNFPTAEYHAKTGRHPVARLIWTVDGEPTQWLTFEKGAFYIYTGTTRAIVNTGDITEADLRASDWHFPEGCVVEVIEKPDIPGDSQATEPTFDVKSPPCVI